MRQVYKVAHHFGIAGNTAKAYIRALQDYGLCSLSNRGIEIAALKYCIQCLINLSESDYKAFAAVRFFREYRKATTVKQYQELIEIGILGRSIGQQQHNYKKIRSIYDFLNNKSVTKGRARMQKIRKMASKLGLSLDEFINYINRLVKVKLANAVTGRFHLSKMVGFSSSTGAKRLVKWNEKGYINRKVVRKDTKEPISSFNKRRLLNDCRYTHLHECGSRGTYIVVLGSKVSINHDNLQKCYATL